MKTYSTLPKKYQIKAGTIKVIDDFAYVTRYNTYNGACHRHGDVTYRVTLEQYNSMRADAKNWEVYTCEPTEENMQLQLSQYISDNCEPYCIGLGYTN